MICPKCKMVYVEGSTVCSECGSALLDNKEYVQKKNSIWFTRFGETTAKGAIVALFYMGIIPFIYISILFGRYLYLNNTCEQKISYMQDGQQWFTSQLVNDSELGVFGGIAFFVILILVWKVVCELLIIIFRAIESYIHRNSPQ